MGSNLGCLVSRAPELKKNIVMFQVVASKDAKLEVKVTLEAHCYVSRRRQVSHGRFKSSGSRAY